MGDFLLSLFFFPVFSQPRTFSPPFFTPFLFVAFPPITGARKTWLHALSLSLFVPPPGTPTFPQNRDPLTVPVPICFFWTTFPFFKTRDGFFRRVINAPSSLSHFFFLSVRSPPLLAAFFPFRQANDLSPAPHSFSKRLPGLMAALNGF